MLAPLLPLGRYYEGAYAAADTNVRAYALAASVTQVRQAGEVLVLDESFGSETGGTSELRALRYLLAFDDVPTRVLKLTPKRLDGELPDGASVLVILSGRELPDYGRLPLEPSTPAPTRGQRCGAVSLLGADERLIWTVSVQLPQRAVEGTPTDGG